MTTKKDYFKAAKQIQEYRRQEMSPDIIDAVQYAFIQFFSDDNPLFDRERFEDYCQK